MKNLKKVLALVVVFTMVLSTVAFASYPDVDATADYAGAVELLSALSILKGDDTGNFNPDNNITRAEFAAVVCRALGLEGSANGAKGVTDFTDVAADHWASGYINLASQQKIINGMGDGTFAPESDVTYTQAVKMLVVALGYEPMAEKKGGYPAGYLATANSIGLTDGVPSTASDVAALRSTVAMLTANAMELPTMEQHTYGTDSLYGINDGREANGYVYDFKSLLTAMDIYIATGTVKPMEDETKQTIEVVLTENSDDGMFTATDRDGDMKSEENRTITIYVNDSDIAAYVNEKVNVYVEKRNSKFYAVAIVPSEEGSTLEIDASLVDLANMDIENKSYFEYYETATSTKTTKAYVKVADGAAQLSVYVNGVKKGSFDAALGLCADQDAVVKLIENNNDKYYDVAEITLFEHYIVTEVDSAKEKITFDGAAGQVNVSFADLLDDETMTIAFADADGNELTVADFKEGDVVAVVAKTPGKVKPTNTNNNVMYFNLGESSVVGAVTSLNASDKVIYIDGTSYDVVDVANLEDGFELGAEGAYYLTMTGKVFKFDGTVSANYKVAYILTAAETEGGVDAGTVQFKLLTADQGIVVVDANSTFKYVVADQRVVKDGDGNVTYDGSFEGKITDLAATLEAFYKAGGTATAADRIVKYKLNSNNKLRSVTAFAEQGAKAETATLTAGAKYYADLGTVGGRELADGAVLFAIDNSDVNKSYVTTAAALNEVKPYGGALVTDYSENKQTYAVGVFDVAQLGGVDAAQGIAVVTKVASTTYEGEEALQVNVKVDSEDTEVVLYFNDESTKVIGNNAYTALTAGSVLLYTAGDDGYVTDYVVLATMANKVLSPDSTATTDGALTAGANGVTYSYAWGYVDTFKSGKVNLTNGNAYKAGGNMYTYEYRGKNHLITAGDYMAADAVGNLETDDNGNVTANYVFMKLANTKVTDIYVVGNRTDVTVRHTIKFVDEDGTTVLQTLTVNDGVTPVPTVTPTKADDETNTYAFAGWTPAITAATANATYTATYTATPKAPVVAADDVVEVEIEE